MESQKVTNKDRKFGSNKEYVYAQVVDEAGELQDALFTIDDTKDGIKRAQDNPEDIPEAKTLWERFFK